MDRADEILYNYCPELQLVDMLDWLQDNFTDYVKIPDLLEADSSISKIYASSLQSDPNLEVSSLDTQQL